jgi:hypothetical protein
VRSGRHFSVLTPNASASSLVRRYLLLCFSIKTPFETNTRNTCEYPESPVYYVLTAYPRVADDGGREGRGLQHFYVSLAYKHFPYFTRR